MSLKTSIKLVSVVIATLFLLILTVPLVSADETTESFVIFTDKEEYLVGEAVSIYVKAEAIDPNESITVSDVIVYDPTNSSIMEWHNLTIVLEDTDTVKYVGTVIATSEGEYTVSAKATGCPWFLWAFFWFFCRCRWHPHVIPEIPLIGTAGAAVAMMSGLGLFIVKRRRPK